MRSIESGYSLLELAEYGSLLELGYALPMIADAEMRIARGLIAPGNDLHLSADRRKLHRIAQEIRENLGHTNAIRLEDQPA